MSYTNEGLKVRMNFDHCSLEYRWQLICNGTGFGQFECDTGAAATHSEALSQIDAAMTARLEG